MRIHYLICLFCISSLFTQNKSKISFGRLDQNSLYKLFNFCKIYHAKKETQLAKKRILSLINKHRDKPLDCNIEIQMPAILIDQIVSILQKHDNIEVCLKKKELDFISKITSHLHHNKLKGHYVWTKEEVKNLDSDDLDIARALLIFQYEDNKQAIQRYECLLDFMALEILGHLKKDASDEEKIEMMNHYIFFEKGFRFPPHSMWTNSSEKFTFLSSVIDSNHGVCLGVSTLYLCLAQRLDLKLNIITPPGHIYLSYEADETINIETTARGVHIDSSNYLNIGLKDLEKRTIKEVVGLNFMNAAAQNWESQEYQEAYDNYKKALLFIKDDPLLNSFIGFICLFLNKDKEALKYLKKANKEHPHQIFNTSIVSDYLNKNASKEGIALLFEKTEESREALIIKKGKLEKLCKSHPKFLDARFSLAATLMQLQRPKEALEHLIAYETLEKNNPTVLYYITALLNQRFNTNEAKIYFKKLQILLEKHSHFPKEYKELKKAIWAY